MFVRFNSPINREIRQQDWERIGVKGQKAVRWDIHNRHILPLSDFTDGAIEAIRDGRADPGRLEIVETDDTPQYTPRYEDEDEDA